MMLQMHGYIPIIDDVIVLRMSLAHILLAQELWVHVLYAFGRVNLGLHNKNTSFENKIFYFRWRSVKTVPLWHLWCNISRLVLKSKGAQELVHSGA